MQRLGINYSRKFPSHFRTHDFKLYEITKKSPAVAFENFKTGLYANLSSNWQIAISSYGIIAFVLWGSYRYWDIDLNQALLNFKGGRPVVRWAILEADKSLGRFDFILNRFENEEGGIRDQ